MSRRASESPRSDDEGQSDDSEYSRFEALTRRLVRVPKGELERKRAQEKARKG